MRVLINAAAKKKIYNIKGIKGKSHCLSTLSMSPTIKLEQFKGDGTENVYAWYKLFLSRPVVVLCT